MRDLTERNGVSKLARNRQEIALMFLSMLVIAAGVLFLYFVGQYALVGRHPFHFFADSDTYQDLYSGFRSASAGVIGVSYNYLGPLLILTVTGGNIYFTMIFNVAMFSISMLFICRALNLNPVHATLIQFISPLTLSSLMSVNKEVIAFPVIALFITGYRSRSITLVAAAILISVLARWQLTVFCMTLVGVYFVRNLNRYVILAALLIFVSSAYYMMQDILQPVLDTVESSTLTYTGGSGLFERLLDLQDAGFYFLVAFVKAAHLLFALGVRFDLIIDPIDIYNDQVVGSYCLANIILFLALVVKRDFLVRNDLIMISLVYLIVFAITPIYAPRYFYPVTILWALTLAGARGGIVPSRAAPIRAVAHAR